MIEPCGTPPLADLTKQAVNPFSSSSLIIFFFCRLKVIKLLIFFKMCCLKAPILSFFLKEKHNFKLDFFLSFSESVFPDNTLYH